MLHYHLLVAVRCSSALCLLLNMYPWTQLVPNRALLETIIRKYLKCFDYITYGYGYDGLWGVGRQVKYLNTCMSNCGKSIIYHYQLYVIYYLNTCMSNCGKSYIITNCKWHTMSIYVFIPTYHEAHTYSYQYYLITTKGSLSQLDNIM